MTLGNRFQIRHPFAGRLPGLARSYDASICLWWYQKPGAESHRIAARDQIHLFHDRLCPIHSTFAGFMGAEPAFYRIFKDSAIWVATMLLAFFGWKYFRQGFVYSRLVGRRSRAGLKHLLTFSETAWLTR